ncbi:DUF4920 domain-containing protein [Fulvivirga ulvae]|uniref:DUF4920 domain-containing protein n=1 Tax=Fulvivirga ulvae TaxID=2904245 RepID=UPI001F1D9F62|nr:DUF4920 domain-containing protein [Fulvivirga ulvae]UII31672.1 DUF4920 domain-containing protein [Fulvivirga ulvae]
MKKVLVIASVCLIMAACGGNQNEQSAEEKPQEEVVSTVTEEPAVVGNYGEEITEEGAISAEELLAKMDGVDSLQVKVSSEILATCKMKGCWMKVEVPGEEEMRVTFKDYGFFVPKEGAEGKAVVMEGIAKKVTTDVETLKHFAKDAGKSEEEIAAITEPKDEITFVATGVIIKDTE